MKDITPQEHLWMEVFIAVARSDNSTRRDTCSDWADYAVEEYNNRFNKGDK